MGRGRSKASGGSSTSATASTTIGSSTLPPVTTFTAPPTPAQIQAGNVLPRGGIPFTQFETMTDDQKADVIDKALGAGVPLFLDDSGLQRFAYFTGMSDKPKLVSDSQLDSIQGTEMFRTVNNAYNSRTDVGYTSKDIYNQITSGDFTMYSDGGGSVHGKALYYATSYTGSTIYGDSRKNPLIMRAKVTSNKVIKESKLSRDYSAALARGDKLAKACNRADYDSARNLYALAKGYDVVDDGSYIMVLNRRAITMSSHTKPATGTRWK